MPGIEASMLRHPVERLLGYELRHHAAASGNRVAGTENCQLITDHLKPATVVSVDVTLTNQRIAQ